METFYLKNNGKTIRDAVHGDIYIPEKFVNIIDTIEFQRLHRVKQLSTAYMLFPTANHSRFSHSIGTYYVMTKLINHFSKLFIKMGIIIDEEKKDLALCTALLHDIGHGPFSHAFENALPKELINKKHEEWTIDIITSEHTQINKVLKENFGNDFPSKISSLITCKFNSDDNLNIFKILSLLISSQLDADRMDYLLRDAFFTGVSHGIFDLDKLIDSLSIDIKNGNVCICIEQKSLSSVEQYVLARYHMYKEVYLHPFKCQMEQIVKKIFKRVYELFLDKKEINIPNALIKIFNKETLTVEEYLTLNDIVITSYFHIWSNSNDDILSFLCDSFLNRYKYTKLDILDNTKSNIQNFKDNLNNLLLINEYDNIKDFNEEYFWIEYKKGVNIYENKEEDIKNIIVRKTNGILLNLSDISNIITKYNTGNSCDKENTIMQTFINHKLFFKKYNNANLQNSLYSLINNFNNRNHIEIEKKYIIEHEERFQNLISFLRKSDNNYIVEELNPSHQIDYYYDTSNSNLYNTKKTLRIRTIDSKNYITIKTPVTTNNSTTNQRFEFEEYVESNNIYDNESIVLKYLPEIKKPLNEKKLINKIVVENNRQKYLMKINEVELEICFDNVKFSKCSSSKEKKDFQIEIELKSNYSHRVILNKITSQIEESFDLQPTTISKFERGLSLLNLEE